MTGAGRFSADFGLGAIGTGLAVLFARLRYDRLRMPPLWSYPDAVVNAIGTAFIDEATFRGLVLGFLVLVGVDPFLAILAQACLYALATRTGAPGRSRYAFGLALWLGLAGGWLTIATGGIGAASLGTPSLGSPSSCAPATPASPLPAEGRRRTPGSSGVARRLAPGGSGPTRRLGGAMTTGDAPAPAAPAAPSPSTSTSRSAARCVPIAISWSSPAPRRWARAAG